MVQDGKVIIALVFASVSMMTRTRQASGGANPSRAKKFKAFHVVFPQFSFASASFSAASFSSSNILLL